MPTPSADRFPACLNGIDCTTRIPQRLDPRNHLGVGDIWHHDDLCRILGQERRETPIENVPGSS